MIRRLHARLTPLSWRRLPFRPENSTTLGGAVGNVMEWYDFSLYGYLAPVLATRFFPGGSDTGALLATFGTFAAGFAMRPFGALLFGEIGDRMGRRVALFLSVALMAGPTFVLGLLPTHAQIGVAAPVLLILVRLVQGLSVGGEFTGSVTYMVETAPPARRGLAGSWANVGGNAGMLLGVAVAALLTSILSADALASWGWRVPFILGGLIGLGALHLRRALPESELFAHDTRHAENSPIRLALSSDRASLLRTVVFACGYGGAFYLPLVYLPTYASEYGAVSLSSALQANAAAMLAVTVVVPVIGLASDRFVRRRTLLVAGFLLLAATAIPLFALVDAGGTARVAAGQTVFALTLALALGAAPAMLAEQFQTPDRETGYALSYNVGFGMVGGTAPLIATALLSATSRDLAPAFYLLVLAIIAMLAVARMPDRSREPLP